LHFDILKVADVYLEVVSLEQVLHNVLFLVEYILANGALVLDSRMHRDLLATDYGQAILVRHRRERVQDGARHLDGVSRLEGGDGGG